MPRFTEEEDLVLIEQYSSVGPKKLGELLNRPMNAIHKRAKLIGLSRGIGKSNYERRNAWEFDNNWSYELGYLIGTYLGDGNVWIDKNHCAYVKLSVIDVEFIEAFSSAVYIVTGFQCGTTTIKKSELEHHKVQYCSVFSNIDFANWLVENFGGAKSKVLKVLPTLEANKGMLEGLNDSEGSARNNSYTIRFCTQKLALEKLLNRLGLKKLNPNSKEIGNVSVKRCNNNFVDRQGVPMWSFTIHESQWAAAGLGTYIPRKVIGSVPLKKFSGTVCYDKDNQPREI